MSTRPGSSELGSASSNSEMQGRELNPLRGVNGKLSVIHSTMARHAGMDATSPDTGWRCTVVITLDLDGFSASTGAESVTCCFRLALTEEARRQVIKEMAELVSTKPLAFTTPPGPLTKAWKVGRNDFSPSVEDRRLESALSVGGSLTCVPGVGTVGTTWLLLIGVSVWSKH